VYLSTPIERKLKVYYYFFLVSCKSSHSSCLPSA